MKGLLRIFSYLFHLVLTLFLIGASALGMAGGPQVLKLGMLPWTGDTLVHVLFFGDIIGLVLVLLAIFGVNRVLFFLWSLLVAVLMIKGFIFSSYHLPAGSLKTAIWLIILSLLALAGAWYQMFQKPARSRK
ncbi:MAG TPA: hypothetical protein VG675_00365 [Bryobacteraceae bacterium]|nr:hypothetical protein [Bryobacteraceae bacterium]